MTVYVDEVTAHHCNCNHVARCTIFTHPSRPVQTALNNLMDIMAEFDDISGSSSILLFESIHPAGVFTTMTWKESTIEGEKAND